MANVQELIETVKGMTVLELNDLVKALQEEFGVSSMAMAAPAAAAGGAAAAEEVEEKTTFDVILTSAGEKKIQVIKGRARANPWSCSERSQGVSRCCS